MWYNQLSVAILEFVPEICRGQVHDPRKERRKRKRIIIIIIIIIIINGAKTISLPNFVYLGDLITLRACTLVISINIYCFTNISSPFYFQFLFFTTKKRTIKFVFSHYFDSNDRLYFNMFDLSLP